jgi:hypothetical protein
MPSKRPLLAGSVDPETHDRWHAFANEHGVSYSALLEAMGRSLPLEPGAKLPSWLRVAVIMATVIDDERSDRRPT